jgi:hypothetical protein
MKKAKIAVNEKTVTVPVRLPTSTIAHYARVAFYAGAPLDVVLNVVLAMAVMSWKPKQKQGGKR